MPPPKFKRILVYFLEFLVLSGGAVLGLYLGFVLFEHFDIRDPFPVLVSAMLLAFVCFIYVLRRTLRFKLEYDAAVFRVYRQTTLQRPGRAKLLRIARRLWMCFPSILPALVLFFFPQVTHFFHLRTELSDYNPGFQQFFPKINSFGHSEVDLLLHDQVRIPWRWTILSTYNSPAYSVVDAIIDDRAPWPFGRKYMLNQGTHRADVAVASLSPDGVRDRQRNAPSWSRIEKTELTSLTIHSHGIELTCLGYRLPWTKDDWTIHCETSSPLQPHNLSADFWGATENLQEFYQLLRNAQPAD
jgi:hypothetical protein